MKRLKQVVTGIVILAIGAAFILWCTDYNSDKVEVSMIEREYTYQGNAEVVSTKADINKASVQTLALIDGIGEKTAQGIIDYRTNYGEFSDISEIQKVKGIGIKTYEQIKDYICISK